jgi:hypothetical protein
MTTMMTMVTLRPFSRVMKYLASFRTNGAASCLPPQASLLRPFG